MNVNDKTSHITIDGRPLCLKHNHLILTEDGDGNRITCDYTDTRVARKVYKHLKKRLANANVRLKGGPCPDSRKGE